MAEGFSSRAMGLELVPDYPLDQTSNVELPEPAQRRGVGRSGQYDY